MVELGNVLVVMSGRQEFKNEVCVVFLFSLILKTTFSFFEFWICVRSQVF